MHGDKIETIDDKVLTRFRWWDTIQLKILKLC